MGPRNNVINKLKIIWKLKVRALFRKMNSIQPETFEYNWVSREKLHERHTNGDTRSRGSPLSRGRRGVLRSGGGGGVTSQ